MKENNATYSNQKTNNEMNSKNNQRKVNEGPLDGDYFSVDYLAELEKEKRANSVNEFRYHSIREDLKRKEEELNAKPPKKKLFGEIIKSSYEDAYDLNQLESIQEYDQFAEVDEDNEESIENIEIETSKRFEENDSIHITMTETTKLFNEDDSNILRRKRNLNIENTDSETKKINEEGPKVNYFENIKRKLAKPKNNEKFDYQEIVEESPKNSYFENIKNKFSKTNEEDIIEEDNYEYNKVQQRENISERKVNTYNLDYDKLNNIEEKNEISNNDNQFKNTLMMEKFESFDEDFDITNQDPYEENGYEEKVNDSIVNETFAEVELPNNEINNDKIDKSEKSTNLNRKKAFIDSETSFNKPSFTNKYIELEETKVIDYEELSRAIADETSHYQEPIITDVNLDETFINEEYNMDASIQKEQGNTDEDATDSGTTFVTGAAWMTAGTVISRIIGALYVIPWATWFGESWTKANTLFSAGYKPYGLFLAIATGGFPSAISKQMSLYHSQKQYKLADKLFKNSLIIMAITGLISGGLLYIIAPFLAENTSVVDKIGATHVIQSLAPALLILPIMSLLRGYFQGFNNMKPTAISQIIEQVARVFYMLAATYAIMVMLNGKAVDAVIQSTFAAFVGAMFALVYLTIVYFRQKPTIQPLIDQDPSEVKIDFKESMIILLKDSIPFIILGSGIIFAQNIDTYTFGQILKSSSSLLMTEIEVLYGVLSLDVDKLIMIIVSLAIALAASTIPLLTATYARKDIEGTRKLLEKIMNVFFFIMLPSAFGMAAIANNLYWVFYPGGSVHGPSILVTASFSSIILGLYTVLSITLQSMSYRRHAVKFLLVGLLVKLILQYPLVALWHAHGAILSTSIGLFVSCILMTIKLNREIHFDSQKMLTDFLRILVPSIIMGVVAATWNNVLNAAFGPVGRLATFGKIMIVVVIAVFVYATLMAFQGLLSILIGDRYADLQKKLRIKL